MKKIKFLIRYLVIISLFAFSGCISMDYNQIIEEDGNTKIEMIMDISALITMTTEMGGIENETKNPCLEISSENSYVKEWNLKCEFDPKGIIKFTGNKKLNEEDGFTIKETLFSTTYIYKPNNITSDILTKTNDEADIVTEDDDFISQAEAVNAEYTYTITMPGEIKSTTFGEINKNKIEIDVFKMLDEPDFTIVSEKKNTILIYSIIIVGILIIILISLLLITKITKKKNNKKANHNINSVEEISNIKKQITPNTISEKIQTHTTQTQVLSRNEKISKEYIEKYKSTYPINAIRLRLIESGIPENEVNTYINKYS